MTPRDSDSGSGPTGNDSPSASPDEGWERTWQIFHQVREAEESVREELLTRLCSGNETLRSEVAELLATEEDSGDFLDDLGGAAGDLLDAAQRDDRVGRYTVVRQIGEGGSGAVYLARRHDGELEQEVALKLLRPGARDPKLLERFHLERQILSRLRHPGIAAVLDAGTTDEGVPYLALEHIEGLPLDRYCREHCLAIPERLRLFAEICDAVAYAHRNLVVHRDLKPGNILVQQDGSPKLLDFGIAKMLESDATMTLEARPMTPRYASPEQVRGKPVTTATDVYALGVILYEMLTGRAPYGGDSSSNLDWIRAIVDETPTRPSATTDSHGAAFETVEDMTPVDRKRLRGDLDAITLRALAKEPERRYPSVEQLAADIGHYLHDEPVSARPDSWGYRATKFVERNRWGVAATAALALVLFAATVTTAVLSVRVNRALERQTEERELAEQTAQFLIDLFEAADPRQGSGEDVSARQVLAQGARRITQDPELAGPIRARLGETVAHALIGLDALDDAEALLGELQSLEEIFSSSADTARLKVLEAEVAYDRAEYETAGKLSLEALDMLEPEPGSGTGSDDAIATIRAAAQLRRALVQTMGGSIAEAADTVQQALDSASSSSSDPLLADVLLVVGRVLMDRGDWHGSEDALRRARALAESAPGGPGYRHAAALRELGLLLLETNRLEEATEVLEEAVERFERLLGSDSPRLPLTYLGNALHGRGDLENAERVLSRSLEISSRAFGEDSPKVAADYTNVGWLLHNRGAFDQARDHYLRAVELHERGSGPDTVQLVPPLNNLGLVHLDLGELAAARPYFEQANNLILAKLGGEHPALGFVLTNQARLEAESGNLEQAESLYREALALRREVLPEDHIELGLTLTGLGDLLCKHGRHQEGERMLREALKIRRAKTAPADWRIALTENDLGACLVAQGRVAEGKPLVANSLDRILAQRGELDPRASRARARLAAL